MKKGILATITVLAVLCTLTLAVSMAWTASNTVPSPMSTAQSATTYTAYRHLMEGHIPDSIGYCSLPSVEDPTSQAEGTMYRANLTCVETGKAATADQLIVWEGYTIWYSCYVYHQVRDCQELQS